MFVFAAHARTGQIRRSDKGDLAVNDNRLCVYPGAQNALEQFAIDEFIVTVEILAKPRTRPRRGASPRGHGRTARLAH